MFEDYKKESFERVRALKDDEQINELWEKLHEKIAPTKYTYNFFWNGFPIIQLPQDLMALQEIIWQTKPEVIIETGVAYGGSLMFSASMLSTLECCGFVQDPLVIGIEINLYPEVLEKLKENELFKKVLILEGSSTDKKISDYIKFICRNRRVLVCLDSNHTHEHVLEELRLYSPLVQRGGYIMVGDTGIENLSNEATSHRPWGKGNNPMTAVFEFLEENEDFEIDEYYHNKLILTGSPNGYLRRTR